MQEKDCIQVDVDQQQEENERLEVKYFRTWSRIKMIKMMLWWCHLVGAAHLCCLLLGVHHHQKNSVGVD